MNNKTSLTNREACKSTINTMNNYGPVYSSYRKVCPEPISPFI